MKAIAYTEFGPAREALRLVDLPDPTPEPGEVLVRVRASGVNPSDVKLRAGRRPGGLAPTMPYPLIVPHSDGAGEIEAVGAGVDPARVGRRVWIWNGQWLRAQGTAAELIALPSAQAVDLPDGVDFAVGACLGIPAVTGWCAVRVGGAVEGRDVLVTGGAGAVGRFAVQCARLSGARRVITTVSGPEKAAEASAVGATHVIDYRREDVAARVMDITEGVGVDRIAEVEFGGNLTVSAEVIRPGGWIVAYASMADPTPTLPFYTLMFKDVTLRALVVYRLDATVRRAAEADLTRWLAAGALDGQIATRLPLAQAAQAHEVVEAGEKRGAVVLDV